MAARFAQLERVHYGLVDLLVHLRFRRPQLGRGRLQRRGRRLAAALLHLHPRLLITFGQRQLERVALALHLDRIGQLGRLEECNHVRQIDRLLLVEAEDLPIEAQMLLEEVHVTEGHVRILEGIRLFSHGARGAQDEGLVLVEGKQLPVLGHVQGRVALGLLGHYGILGVLGDHLGAHLGRRLADAIRERRGEHPEDAAALFGVRCDVLCQPGVLHDISLDCARGDDAAAGQVAQQERHLADEVALAALGHLLCTFQDRRGALPDEDGRVRSLALSDHRLPILIRLWHADIPEEGLTERLRILLRLEVRTHGTAVGMTFRGAFCTACLAARATHERPTT